LIEDEDDPLHLKHYCRYECEHGFVGSWFHVAEDMRDNDFLLTGYRIGFEGYRIGFKTMFIIHNETVNIWSHFFGKLFFIGVMIAVVLSCPVLDGIGLPVQTRINA
jgi:hypothetical protein